jgi:hypothetical protein
MVKPRNFIYLKDFLNRAFLRENAKNRAFYGEEKLRAASVYHYGIKHGAELEEIDGSFTCIERPFQAHPIMIRETNGHVAEW